MNITSSNSTSTYKTFLLNIDFHSLHVWLKISSHIHTGDEFCKAFLSPSFLIKLQFWYGKGISLVARQPYFPLSRSGERCRVSPIRAECFCLWFRTLAIWRKLLPRCLFDPEITVNHTYNKIQLFLSFQSVLLMLYSSVTSVMLIYFWQGFHFWHFNASL